MMKFIARNWRETQLIQAKKVVIEETIPKGCIGCESNDNCDYMDAIEFSIDCPCKTCLVKVKCVEGCDIYIDHFHTFKPKLRKIRHSKAL